MINPATRPLPYRLAVFGYGVLAYFIGAAAFLALIATMLGLVPFTGGPVGPLDALPALALDVLLLVLFGLQHSVMARASFKERWTQLIPAAAERSTYLLATGIVTGPLLWLWSPLPATVWSIDAPLTRMCVTGLALLGWAYLMVATFAINHFELFGLQQVYQTLRGRPITTAAFRERWMYRYDRHPIMTGVLIGVWVTPTMTMDHLLFAAGMTVYVWIGVYFEERSLQRQLGPAYDDYRRRVGSVVPSFVKPSLMNAPVAVVSAASEEDGR